MFCNFGTGDPGDPGHSPTPGPTKSAAPDPNCEHPSGPGIPTKLDCDGCAWEQVVGIPVGPHSSNFEQMRQVFERWEASDPRGILDLVTCYPGASQTLRFYPYATPPVHAPTAGTLGAWAEAKLLFPTITPHLGPDRRLRDYPTAVVGLPAQLWVDQEPAPPPATADDGVQTVTATATATTVTWDMGDGTPGSVFTCPADAPAWQERTMPTGCVYTYRRSSASQPQIDLTDPNDRPFVVTVTVDYTVDWTCGSDHPDTDPDACGGVTGGSLTHVTTTRWNLVVGEIQAVNVPVG